MNPWTIETVKEDDGTITVQMRYAGREHVARFSWRLQGQWLELFGIQLLLEDGRPAEDGAGWLAVNVRDMTAMSHAASVKFLEQEAEDTAAARRGVLS